MIPPATTVGGGIKSGGALTMASAEREPITGVWGGAPSEVQGRAPGQGVRGRSPSPPEAESFLRIGHPKEGANWPHVRALNERNCILLLDSNETGGLIVINVIWSHFLFDKSQKTAS